MGRRSFGFIRKLPSGRYQASYVGPDLRRHNAPATYTARMDAEAWLYRQRAAVESGEWRSPALQAAEAASRQVTLGEHAGTWLERRSRDLAPRTVKLYRQLIRDHIAALGSLPLAAVTPEAVRGWWDALDTGPTARANAYTLLRTVLGDAVDRGLIPANPARVKGAGGKKRARKLRVMAPGEFDALAEAMPGRYRALVLLGGWCALRFGELAALRRSDLDLDAAVVHVRRAVTVVDGQTIIGKPKGDAVRPVDIPPHILPDLRAHLDAYADPGRDGLLFPPAYHRGHLSQSTLHRVFNRARQTIGRPDIRPHDLRHHGAIQAARAGATLGELQQRLGHSTAAAALVYQSAASDRGAEIARRLSAMARG